MAFDPERLRRSQVDKQQPPTKRRRLCENLEELVALKYPA
ncbi:hypothetical protein IB211_01566 [Intestinimonas butyriciproducens]|uniref:Uncharacterized protein n=1 Tax=Intestinimonas butyriciproducens TaxID=1297617 RepID=A0A0S2W3P3_9FIRM|nr:hypothetical protein IB211_01566 [Intestinimonas butyriciproducens]